MPANSILPSTAELDTNKVKWHAWQLRPVWSRDILLTPSFPWCILVLVQYLKYGHQYRNIDLRNIAIALVQVPQEMITELSTAH